MGQERKSRHILVLGLGNALMQDEGLGVHALRRLLSSYCFPEYVELLDGGTMGLALLPYVAETTDLLILDCVHAAHAPGTLVRLEGPDIHKALSLKMSIHQVGLQDLLTANSLAGTSPENIVVWGIQPGSVDWGVELTPVVEGSVDRLLQAVVQELRAWGVCVEPSERSTACG